MARFLALDWDNREFHLVAANVHRGRIHIQRAISWREEEAFQVGQAEQFGNRLRERMKAAGIGAAPLIIGLGRDRVVVKEVRFPQVSPDVEALIVRNQIVKELTEAPEDVTFDYAPLEEPSKNGERRAMSVIVRKDLIAALQTIAREAGLKLISVTARPFGAAACLKRLAGATPQVPAPPAADAVAGVLTIAGTWAEFCAVRGNQPLFARSMMVGDGVLGEVRRNLAAYSGQPHLTFPRDAIQVLYVSGNGENAVLREKLQQTLGIPVHGMDPFALEDRVDVDANTRAGYTGAVGLLQLWAEEEATPINFVKPRESTQAASPVKRRVVVYGVLGGVAVAAAIALAFFMLGEGQTILAQKRAYKTALEKRLKDLGPEVKYMEALKDWNDGAIPWIDEFYDLAARMPFNQGMRLTRISVVPITTKGAAKDAAKAKDAFVAVSSMTIEGTVEARNSQKIHDLLNSIKNDPHCRGIITKLDDKTSANRVDFTLKVEIARQPPLQYKTRLTVR